MSGTESKFSYIIRCDSGGPNHEYQTFKNVLTKLIGSSSLEINFNQIRELDEKNDKFEKITHK